MRRQALHSEGAGDADLPVVIVGLVVEVFVVRLGGDGGVDLLLPGYALFPPETVKVRRLRGPGVARLGGNVVASVLPAQGLVQLAQRRRLLPVRGRGLEPCPTPWWADSGHGSPASRGICHSSQSRLSAAFNSSLSGSSLSWKRSQITSISTLLAMDLRVMWGTRSYTKPWRMSLKVGASEGALREIFGLLDSGRLGCPQAGSSGYRAPMSAGSRQREGYAGGVDGDPATAPLLGDVRGGAGAAGGVEDEVAGVGGHQDAALNDFGIRCLHNVDLGICSSCECSTSEYVRPHIVENRVTPQSHRSTSGHTEQSCRVSGLASLSALRIASQHAASPIRASNTTGVWYDRPQSIERLTSKDDVVSPTCSRREIVMPIDLLHSAEIKLAAMASLYATLPLLTRTLDSSSGLSEASCSDIDHQYRLHGSLTLE